jgi:hypothetical protein
MNIIVHTHSNVFIVTVTDVYIDRIYLQVLEHTHDVTDILRQDVMDEIELKVAKYCESLGEEYVTE